MKNMAFKVVERLFIVVYGTTNPTDEEWVRYLDACQEHGLDRTVQLIFTDGGGPDSSQRKYLNQLLDGRMVPVAVVSSSSAIRSVVTALSWFNRQIKAFSPGALRDAISYLQIPPGRFERIAREVDILRLELVADRRASA